MKKLLGLLVAMAALFAFVIYDSADAGSRLLQANGKYVVKLLNPANPNSGGTGFSVIAPSGKPYLLSNGHVCALGKDGYMVAELGGSKRRMRVRIIEISEKTDLCILEGITVSSGLQLAPTMWEHERLTVLGHPLLNDLTLSEGFAVSRQVVDIMTGQDQESCVGPGYAWEEVPSIWGIPMGICKRSVDAWDSSIVIYPGNSGSPVLNRRGDVVGVVFAGYGSTNYGSFVPLDVVRDFISVY